MEQKKRSVRSQFGRRASAYARSESHAKDRDLDVLLGHLSLSASDRLLDVATGTGFTALAAHARGASVVGVDLTHDMLLEAIRLASLEARSWSSTVRLTEASKIQWVEGDVEALPFRAETFSVVTCRRAPHHFVHLDRAIGEMLRVLQPGGRIGIVDQVNPENPVGQQLMNELEILRDPSHVHALTKSEWRSVFDRHQVSTSFIDVVELRQSFERWLALAGTEVDRRRAVEEALRRATPEALKEIGYEEKPERAFLKRWGVFVGRKR